ncbi:hypothetical protein ES708_22155 [subsurface metagenome]
MLTIFSKIIPLVALEPVSVRVPPVILKSPETFMNTSPDPFERLRSPLEMSKLPPTLIEISADPVVTIRLPPVTIKSPDTFSVLSTALPNLKELIPVETRLKFPATLPSIARVCKSG